MEQKLQDDLKAVAEWYGWKELRWTAKAYGEMVIWTENDITVHHGELDFNINWRTQIPVWAKLYAEDKLYRHAQSLNIRLEYAHAVNLNDPQKGFEIIYAIIEQLKHDL